MSGNNSLADVLARVEALQAALQQATSRTDHERKLEIVNLRRSLALELGGISAAAEREPWIADNQELAHEFHTRFSAMRSMLALHQSQWPAVSLDDVKQPYHESTRAIRRASAEFLDWTKAQIATHR